MKQTPMLRLAEWLGNCTEYEFRTKTGSKVAELLKDESELITKQQIQIEEYKELLKENKELRNQIIGKFYSIGQPLNDNVLQMNKNQISWCFGVVELAEQLNSL